MFVKVKVIFVQGMFEKSRGGNTQFPGIACVDKFPTAATQKSRYVLCVECFILLRDCNAVVEYRRDNTLGAYSKYERQ
jgi:hypothetical protein